MNKLSDKIDKWLLAFMIIYSLLGLVMIFSASTVSAVQRYGVSSSYFFIRQLIFIVIAFVCGFAFFIRFPTRKYKYLIWPALLITIGGLILVLVLGKSTNSARSWLKIGAFSIQPAEFAKTVLIIYMAMFFGFKKKIAGAFAFLIPLAMGILVAILVAMQPDLGGAVIISAIVFFLFLSVPFSKNNKAKVLKIIGIGVVVAALSLVYFGNNILNSRQLKRLNFKNPCSRYTEETGYQVCNGLIAINNGGLFGLGLGNSTQKYLYLPESHTDFIFSIIVEELGAIVGVVIILGYIFMLIRVMRIAKNSETLRGSIIAYGTFLFMIMHLLVNLLGVLGVIPLTGVPLPFLSYGGSFNLNIIILLFITQRVAIESKIIKNKQEIANM